MKRYESNYFRTVMVIACLLVLWLGYHATELVVSSNTSDSIGNLQSKKEVDVYLSGWSQSKISPPLLQWEKRYPKSYAVKYERPLFGKVVVVYDQYGNRVHSEGNN